ERLPQHEAALRRLFILHRAGAAGTLTASLPDPPEAPALPMTAEGGTETVMPPEGAAGSPDHPPTRGQLPPPAAASPGGGPLLSPIPGYEILGVLGRGGMGVVYKARHLRLKCLVALKMVLSGAHAGPAELARFRTEVEAVARLHHAHIVHVYD